MSKAKLLSTILASLFLSQWAVMPALAEDSTPDEDELSSKQVADQSKQHAAALAAKSGDVVASPPGQSAAELAPVAPPLPSLPTVLSFAVGPSLVKSGVSNTLELNDGSIAQFHPRHPLQVQTLYNAFLGVAYQFLPAWSVQAGISYTQPSTFTMEGIESQNTAARNYDYNYNITGRQLLVEGHLVYDWKRLHPYVALGMGPSFNSAYVYKSFPPPGTTNNPTFTGNNNTAFSVAAGVGVDVDVMQSVRLGIGYRFADFGKANLGRGYQFAGTNNQTVLSQTIQQNNLYVNALMVQITFLPF